MSTEIATETVGDRWGGSPVDLDAYLARIGRRRREPSAAELAELATAHVRSFPFENVDVLLGVGPEVTTSVVGEKFLGRNRGGYCFEHVLLFAAVLEQLGYRAWRVLSRRHPDGSGYRTHGSVIVDVDGMEYLADVGFGAGIPRIMPLCENEVTEQVGVAHRLMFRDGAWTLEEHGADGWGQLHAFELDPAWPSDFELANHFISTHPNSPFVGKLVVFRTDADRVRRLVGDRLSVRYLDGTTRHETIAAEQLPEVLAGLGVRLEDAESAALLETQRGRIISG